MTKLFNIILVLLLFSTHLSAQFKITSVIPSFYFTTGDYSNNNSSFSYTGYVSLGFNDSDFFNAGLDFLTIDDQSVEYNQTALYMGWVKNIDVFRFKINYAQIDGTYDDNSVDYKYSDYLKIYNIGFAYNYNQLVLGALFSYMNMIGNQSLNGRQYEFSASWLPSDFMSISVNPVFINLNDSRKLYSIGGDLTYKLTDKLKININGFIGERAYYFNSDLLWINKREETQKYLTEIKAEYIIAKTIVITASAQKTKFGNYHITYLSGGGKVFL
ncbi:MAG: hypothetical protein KKB34_14135 [Bacteroidetes bacterium]|nr:hypothetical protein [Bacteroidota bacterium]